MANNVGIVGWGTDLSWLKMRTAVVVEKREKDKLKKSLPQLDEKEIDQKVAEKLKTYDFLGMRTKTIAPYEDDSVTYAVQAAHYAIQQAQIDPKQIGLVKVGSETSPYKTGPTIAYHVATFLGMGPQIWEEDTSNACNAGMQAVRDAWFCVKAGEAKYGLGIGSDVARGAVGSPLEYAVGAGASAWLIGKNAPIVIRDMTPYTETRHLDIDFWVREDCNTPEVFGDRSTICYTECVISSLALLLMKHPNLTVKDFDNLVPHQPFEYMPIKTLRLLDPSRKDRLHKLLKTALNIEDPTLEKRMELPEADMLRALKPGLLSPEIGNIYAASSQTGACHIFNQADQLDEKGEPLFRKGKRILLLSYGSGTRGMAVDLEVTDPKTVMEMVHRAPTTFDFLARMKFVSKLHTYSANLKERIGSVKERLVHRRIIGELEPIGTERLYEDICDCESIFYPARKEEWSDIFSKGTNNPTSHPITFCLDTDCKGNRRSLALPVKAKLLSAQVLPLREAVWRRITTSYEIIYKGYSIIVDTIYDRLYPGMILTPRCKRLDYKGSKGLVQYGIAYAPPVPRLGILKTVCGNGTFYQDLLSTLVKYPDYPLSKDEKVAYYSGVRSLCIGDAPTTTESFIKYTELLTARGKKADETETKQFINPQIERNTRIIDNAQEYATKAEKYNRELAEVD